MLVVNDYGPCILNELETQCWDMQAERVLVLAANRMFTYWGLQRKERSQPCPLLEVLGSYLLGCHTGKTA